MSIKKGLVLPVRVLGISGIILVGFIVFILFGTLVAYIAAIICRKQLIIMYLPRIPYANLIQIGVILSGAISIAKVVRKVICKSPGGLEPILACIFVNVLLSIAASLFLPGAVFLFSIPPFLAAVYGIVAVTSKSHILKTAAFALTAITTLVFYIPLLYLFYLALTLGAAGIIAFFALIGLSVLVPVFYHYVSSGFFDEGKQPICL